MCWALEAELLTIKDASEERWLKDHIPDINTHLPQSYRDGVRMRRHAFIWLGLSNFQVSVQIRSA